jgi:hypothetical protein
MTAFSASNVMLAIEHVVTADMADGQPLPPYIDAGVVWHAVRRQPAGTTLWRRIALQTSNTSPSATAARPREDLGGM